MITLGIDIGSSSIKTALIDTESGECIGRSLYPPDEMKILAPQKSWAEQDPEDWMENTVKAVSLLRQDYGQAVKNVGAIGITYQMHGLVTVDENGHPIRNSIIWCDCRAVNIGDKAFADLGEEYCLNRLLNSPGNFTASKLSWVKQHEPDNYKKIHKILLPGDYIAYKLTNEIRTTRSGLSEGVFWDFEKNAVSEELINYYGFDKSILPEVVDTFSEQGTLTSEMAGMLGMKPGIPVSYRAGDQPNNAFSLNVLHPGEVAATAGTSGVVYGVTGQKKVDQKSRVNTFLHVNHSMSNPRLGILLCLNSVGILNSRIRQFTGQKWSYAEMNEMASKSPEGAGGLQILPFGNGAERVLENNNIGASFHHLNLNTHDLGHVMRAVQEGIAFAFQYGLEIMNMMGLNLSVIRAGYSNMFLSDLFAQTLANVSGAKIELYNTNGAEGAARGAALGAGYYKSASEAFGGLKVLNSIQPDTNSQISQYYNDWKQTLTKLLN